MNIISLAGIDCLLSQNPWWKHHRIGIVTNDSACTHDGITTRKALVNHGFNVVCIFSPEHGLHVMGPDGVPLQDTTDPVTLLPVISLYGSKLFPSECDLSKIDILLFDIPDAGARFYTYLWTMTHCMESCAIVRKPFIILDRPNPLSGDLSMAEGPFLQENTCSSFVGRWCIPVRHSCTTGELATYFNAIKKISCSLEIISCKNWKRSQYHTATGWNFIPTSPALQRFESMLLYPGTCFLEATNLHEGRGTQLAFSLVAAPWLGPEKLISYLKTFSIPGIGFKMTQFTSSTHKYTGSVCRAVLFFVTDPEKFKPVQFGLILLYSLKKLFPSFGWDLYPSAVNPTGKNHLDRLMGIPHVEKLFDGSRDEFLQNIKRQCVISAFWQEQVGKYLLYD